MGEKLTKFCKDAAELQHKVHIYQSTFKTLNDLFPKDSESHTISGKVTLARRHPAVGHVEVAVVINKLTDESDLKIDLGIEIGKKNIAKLEQIELPLPSHVSGSVLEEINNNDLLEEVVRKIMMSEDANKSFVPVN